MRNADRPGKEGADGGEVPVVAGAGAAAACAVAALTVNAFATQMLAAKASAVNRAMSEIVIGCHMAASL